MGGLAAVAPVSRTSKGLSMRLMHEIFCRDDHLKSLTEGDRRRDHVD